MPSEDVGLRAAVVVVDVDAPGVGEENEDRREEVGGGMGVECEE